jgi:hypothetical protein
MTRNRQRSARLNRPDPTRRDIIAAVGDVDVVGDVDAAPGRRPLPSPAAPRLWNQRRRLNHPAPPSRLSPKGK